MWNMADPHNADPGGATYMNNSNSNTSTMTMVSGGLFDVQLNDVLSADLNGLTFNVPDPPPGANGPGADDYTFEYLAAGEVVNA